MSAGGGDTLQMTQPLGKDVRELLVQVLVTEQQIATDYAR